MEERRKRGRKGAKEHGERERRGKMRDVERRLA